MTAPTPTPDARNEQVLAAWRAAQAGEIPGLEWCDGEPCAREHTPGRVCILPNGHAAPDSAACAACGGTGDEHYDGGFRTRSCRECRGTGRVTSPATPDTPAPLSAGEREERVVYNDEAQLAEALRRCGVEVGSVGGDHFRRVVANRLLESDWLARYVARHTPERDALAERVEDVTALFSPGGDYEPCPRDAGCQHAECEVAYAVQMELGVIHVRVLAALDVSPEADEAGGGR